jgi:hypothetical protein
LPLALLQLFLKEDLHYKVVRTTATS